MTIPPAMEKNESQNTQVVVAIWIIMGIEAKCWGVVWSPKAATTTKNNLGDELGPVHIP